MNNKQILDRLDSIAKNCSGKNWDSYGAGPISPETISLAKKNRSNTFQRCGY